MQINRHLDHEGQREPPVCYQQHSIRRSLEEKYKNYEGSQCKTQKLVAGKGRVLAI